MLYIRVNQNLQLIDIPGMHNTEIDIYLIVDWHIFIILIILVKGLFVYSTNSSVRIHGCRNSRFVIILISQCGPNIFLSDIH